MTTFDDRKKQEESRYKHDQELLFKARNRGNRMFGLWVAAKLGLDGEAAAAYAKDVVMADFDSPGVNDVYDKVKADLAAQGVEVSDHLLEKHLAESRAQALEQ